MFKMLTDAIDNTLSVVGGVLTGELPTQRQVAQMISDGMTVAAIASATGLATDVIAKILEQEA
jgi:DNA-binding NarL/FixJ family response regulator